jgi:peptidoglycan/LPS O-acetylase OafA/YrhL
MRFFLAFWVVLFHGYSPTGFLSAVTFPNPLSRLFNTGYMAVGMFFVLSGFVLAYNYPLERT